MRKLLTCWMLVLALCFTMVPQKASAATFAYDRLIISVQNYYQTGDSDYTQAIIRSNAYLKANGGGTVLFPAGDYKIKPGQIRIGSNTKWKGIGTARLFTQESSLYNILIGTESSSKNIAIENLVFDQRKDVAQEPSSANSKACILLHIGDADLVEIMNCTFYSYGVCAVLVQSHYETPTENITVSGNKAFFERKVNSFYDVSVFNIDARTVHILNNSVEGKYVAGFQYWKPRSGFEIHGPNGEISNNTALNIELGILHVSWPMLWDTYEPAYSGRMDILNNSIQKAIIGIDCWSANSIAGINTQNLTIKNNKINLHLDNLYVPARGIALGDGDISGGRIEHVLIDNNDIVMTADPAITDISARMNQLISGNIVGAMYMNLGSTIRDLVISNNRVTNFAYNFLNLYRRNKTGTFSVHDNIEVFGNIITDTAYTRSYGGMYDALYNIGNSNDVSIHDNTVVENTRKCIAYLGNLGGVTLLQYNTAAPALPAGTKTYVYSNVIGTWANPRQIYVTNVQQCAAGQHIITPNGQDVVLEKVSGNYIYTLSDMTSWTGGKIIQGYVVASPTPAPTPKPTPAPTPIPTSIPSPIQTTAYAGVIGTWANARQIYVTNVLQCAAGDQILTPNGEKATLEKVAGNYIYTTSNVASWYGGKNITYIASAVVPAPAPTPTPAPTPISNTSYANVIGTWANARQIYVTNVSQCAVGDHILTPNGESAILQAISGNYIYTATNVAAWSGGKPITYVSQKVYVNVIGTWASARQIYVTNVAQCAAGDVIVTPNGEVAVLEKVMGNYIYTNTDVAYWFGGKTILAD